MSWSRQTVKWLTAGWQQWNKVSVPSSNSEFPLHMQAGSGGHSAFYLATTWGFLAKTEVGVAWWQPTHMHLAQAMDQYSCTYTSHIFLMWCLVKHISNFVINYILKTVCSTCGLTEWLSKVTSERIMKPSTTITLMLYHILY